MNGLRIFIRPDADSIEEKIFYSQRGHGPMYRWHYEAHRARWQGARIDASHWGSNELCSARWQSVPPELKTQLSEHYIE
jgi:hypothetical protein